MWGFGLMFWLVVCMFFAVVARRRRWERWAMMGRPRGYPVYPGWWDSREWRTPRREPATRRQGSEEQQEYIDALESRVAQLEERLDFTEQLLAGRRDRPADAT